MTWALFLLGCFGLAYIVGHSAISYPVRFIIGGDDAVKPLVPHLGPLLIALVECPACFGFWTGFGAAWLGVPVESPATWGRFIWALALGCIVSGSNFLLSKFSRLIA